MVVAAGGDGTIGLVGRQLIGARTALGILPLGSVMNIPRMLGVPRDLDEAARILADGHVRSIDVGQVGDRIFYEAGSVGMHAAATRELPKVDKGDYGAIIRSIVAAVRYRPSEMRIELDGDRTIETKALLVAVANGPFMGPGLPIAPEASLDDGLFDVRVFLHYTKGRAGPLPHEHRLRSPRGRAALPDRAGEPGPHHEPTTAPRACRRRGPGNDPGRLRDPTEGPARSSLRTDQRHRAGRVVPVARPDPGAGVSGRPPRRRRETPADAATRHISHSAPAR